ncbi:MAG TPA: response regulator [Candidatus Angelobacter sp.]|nr:response regulator [Candidatus Angelobacter sp.]
MMTEASVPSPYRLARVRLSILCVDDSLEMLEICRTLLETSGYQVYTAKSAAEALSVLRSHAIDAVVVDYQMPDMNGEDLGREIKFAAPGMPVVMFSGAISGNESFSCIDACLSKGKGPIALRKLLDSLLRSK